MVCARRYISDKEKKTRRSITLALSSRIPPALVTCRVCIYVHILRMGICRGVYVYVCMFCCEPG